MSSFGTVPIDLTPELVARIVEIGRLRAPNEACGILLPTPRTAHGTNLSRVVELPNRSLEQSSYLIKGADIQLELADWIAANPEDANRVAIWHTHPGGNIGPSPGDMRARVAGLAYLVVSLTKSEAVPTWF